MKKKLSTTIGKAYEINKKRSIYGSFAEIGAGQETVHYFFKAGLASQTIAKSMSAYDMTFSDAIYGKQSSYVCRKRLMTMLDHEYKLLEKRLKAKQGSKTQFFAFSTTAATKSKKRASSPNMLGHAWMGLRFQMKPKSAISDITFHVSCLDEDRLNQQEALGILGVNLIYACFNYKDPKKFISSLSDRLKKTRIAIDSISCKGPAFKKDFSKLLNDLL